METKTPLLYRLVCANDQILYIRRDHLLKICEDNDTIPEIVFPGGQINLEFLKELDIKREVFNIIRAHIIPNYVYAADVMMRNYYLNGEFRDTCLTLGGFDRIRTRVSDSPHSEPMPLARNEGTDNQKSRKNMFSWKN